MLNDEAYEDVLKPPKERAYRLKKRLTDKKRTLDQLWEVLNCNNSYFILNVFANSVLFSIFFTWNKKLEVFSNPNKDFAIWDNNQRTFVFENNNPMNDDGEIQLPHGKIKLERLQGLHAIGDTLGCAILVLLYRYRGTRLTIILSAISSMVFLMSLGTKRPFYDRFSYITLQLLSKAICILTLQSIAENGPRVWRMYSMGFAFFMKYTFTLIPVAIYRKMDVARGNQTLLFIMAAMTAVYSILIPNQLVLSIVNRDSRSVKAIIKKFSTGATNEPLNVEANVDDIHYHGHVPFSVIEGLRYLFPIRPFRNKLIGLTIVLVSLSLVDACYKIIIGRLLSPFTPHETTAFSSILSSFSIILTVALISKFSRRTVLLGSIFVSALGFFLTNIVRFSEHADCFSVQRPLESSSLSASLIYVVICGSMTSSSFLILYYVLEHIPSIYRSFLFPIVITIESCAIYVGLRHFENERNSNIFETCFYLTVFAFLVAAFSVDGTIINPFSTSQVRCYTCQAKKVKKVANFAPKKITTNADEPQKKSLIDTEVKMNKK